MTEFGRSPTILVMAGGTGGHVIPALTVAARLQDYGCRVEWLGTRTGIEAELVERAALPITYIKVAGLRGKSRLNQLLAPARLLVAFWQSLRAMRKVRPACVLGMGGFASGPGGLAAWLLRKPLVIHEQNAIAGLTNRCLYRLADRVLQAFPGAFGALDKSGKARTVGNPVRGDILGLPAPAERLRQHSGPIRLLVLGGSLGARTLNQQLPVALAQMEASTRPRVLHQTGKQHLAATQAAYSEAGVEAEVVDFIADMAQAYNWADLVLCRAGALTLAELACVGLAAILVPYPYAVDDHQTHNAKRLQQAGAAVLLPERELSAVKLAALLAKLSQRGELIQMADKGRTLAQPESAEQVAQYCLEIAGFRAGGDSRWETDRGAN